MWLCCFRGAIVSTSAKSKELWSISSLSCAHQTVARPPRQEAVCFDEFDWDAIDLTRFHDLCMGA